MQSPRQKVDPWQLRDMIQRFLEEHTCRGSSHPQMAMHCAECCYGTGWLANCQEELDTLVALEVALSCMDTEIRVLREVRGEDRRRDLDS